MMKFFLGILLALFAPLAFAAGINPEGLIQMFIYLVLIALIFWVLWWLLGYLAVPEPFNKVLRVVLAVAAALVVIYFLLGVARQLT